MERTCQYAVTVESNIDPDGPDIVTRCGRPATVIYVGGWNGHAVCRKHDSAEARRYAVAHGWTRESTERTVGKAW